MKDESGNFYISIIMNNKLHAIIFPSSTLKTVNKVEKKIIFNCVTSVFSIAFKLY